MVIMNYFVEFDFKIPSQKKSQKTLTDIVETVSGFSELGDLAKLKTRELSSRSGYSLGAIFHHFRSFDEIFIYIFILQREKSHLRVAEIINNHSPNEDLSVLAGEVLNCLMDMLLRPNRKALLFVVSIFFKVTKKPHLINTGSDILIPAWMNACQRDKTNTLFMYTENEIRLRFRAIQTVIRGPFFEDDVIAGTAEHKEMALNILIRLFTPPPIIK